jgi:negative regulator of sigma E activity
MSDADLWGAWRLWLGVAVVTVALAAALLVAVIATARQIVAQAGRAKNAAEAIRVNTLPIWNLQTSNEVAADLLATVRSIEQNGGALAEALTHQR